MIEDEKIIELFNKRSEQAISELDKKYGKFFQKLSYNIVNNKQDAEECVNDAYLGAWNTIPPTNPNPLLTYICKIVRNISLKNYCKKEASKRKSNYTVAMEEMEACLSDPKTVESEADAKELTKILESFLDTLTVENRVIYVIPSLEITMIGDNRYILPNEFAESFGHLFDGLVQQPLPAQ